MLADEEMYTIANKWRAVRGAPPLVPPADQIASDGSGLGTGAGLAAQFLGIQQ